MPRAGVAGVPTPLINSLFPCHSSSSRFLQTLVGGRSYHHCRLAGLGSEGLLGVPLTEASCDTWRQVDVLALMLSISFVAGQATTAQPSLPVIPS